VTSRQLRAIAAAKEAYQPATNPAWQSRGLRHDPASFDKLREAMRSVYRRCTEGGQPPSAAIIDGVLYTKDDMK